MTPGQFFQEGFCKSIVPLSYVVISGTLQVFLKYDIPVSLGSVTSVSICVLLQGEQILVELM